MQTKPNVDRGQNFSSLPSITMIPFLAAGAANSGEVKMRISRGLRLAIKKMGTKGKLAKALGIREQSINRWRAIPRKRVLSIHIATGIPVEDLYDLKSWYDRLRS